MDDAERVRLSKLLSWALRHAPTQAGIELDDAGWTDVPALLSALAARGESLDRAGLRELVETSDKQRFRLSDDGSCIRASQGHSVDVDLGLSPALPPERLFHGTVARFIDEILSAGLMPRERHHVHLSESFDAASDVGRRRGAPIVLSVAAAAMVRDGHVFYLSDNGVWLVDAVDPKYLEVVE